MITKSPLFNFLLGMFFGAAVSAAIVLHLVTNEVEARNAAIAAGVEETAAGQRAQTQTIYDNAMKAIDAWQARAEKCEAKFTTATVIYEPQPRATIAEFPLLHGLAGITLHTGGKESTSQFPVYVIPAQVAVYSNAPGNSFQWIDGKTGESKGSFLIAPPPVAAQ